MAHHIRLAMREDAEFWPKFVGTVEVDETYVGGKRSGIRGRGAANKVPVVGLKDRTSGHVRMHAVENVKATTLASSFGPTLPKGVRSPPTNWARISGWIALSLLMDRSNTAQPMSMVTC